MMHSSVTTVILTHERTLDDPGVIQDECMYILLNVQLRQYFQKFEKQAI